MLTGVQNILPGHGLPPVGPWWFIPFIMQWYCLWGFVRAMTKRYGAAALVGLSVAGLVITHVVRAMDIPGINLLETPIGHMPELCLGLVAARYRPHLTSPVVLAGAAVAILGNIFEFLWPLAAGAVLLPILWTYRVLRGFQPKLLIQIGAYATPLFLLNGAVRIPFVQWASAARWDAKLIATMLGAAASIAVAVAAQNILAALQKRHVQESSVTGAAA